MAIFTLCLIASTLVASTVAQDYCSICSDHTMCLYQGMSSSCGSDIPAYGVDDNAKATIVDIHNRLRNKVATGQETAGINAPQPSAANMRKMSWNDEIANIAQRWADQCTWGHDACRNTADMYVGQNIYALFSSSASPEPDWESAINSWYNEVQNFDSNNVDNYQFDSNTGHYTQVVWADTHFVGCGYLVFYAEDRYNHYYFCNYAPGGNYIGAKVYQRGDPCSQCDSTCDSDYPGLCA